jgi:hypothetical protein
LIDKLDQDAPERCAIDEDALRKGGYRKRRLHAAAIGDAPHGVEASSERVDNIDQLG